MVQVMFELRLKVFVLCLLRVDNPPPYSLTMMFHGYNLICTTHSFGPAVHSATSRYISLNKLNRLILTMF